MRVSSAPWLLTVAGDGVVAAAALELVEADRSAGNAAVAGETRWHRRCRRNRCRRCLRCRSSVSVPTPAAAGDRAGGQIDGDAGSRIGIDRAVEALAAVERVVAGEALQPVVAAEALDGVVAGRAGQRVWRRCRRRVTPPLTLIVMVLSKVRPPESVARTIDLLRCRRTAAPATTRLPPLIANWPPALSSSVERRGVARVRIDRRQRADDGADWPFPAARRRSTARCRSAPR